MTHARTLIADFCPISRCDGVIKSLFNRTTPSMYVCTYAHTRHRITRATVRNVIRISRRSSLDDRALAPVVPLLPRWCLPTDCPSVCLSVSERNEKGNADSLPFICMRKRERERERRDLQSDVNDDHLPPFLNSKWYSTPRSFERVFLDG